MPEPRMDRDAIYEHMKRAHLLSDNPYDHGQLESISKSNLVIVELLNRLLDIERARELREIARR